jgi:ACS family sodium-dependent inorganic phosphate cotransporter
MMGLELINWLIRQAIPALMLFMKEDKTAFPHGISEAEEAVIVGAYFSGYGLMLVPAGALAKVLGGHRCLIYSLVGIGLALMAVPTCARFGASAVAWSLALVGALSSPFMPARLTLLAKWMPKDENAEALTIIKNGNLLGKIFGAMLANLLAGAFGWTNVFYFIGQ